MINKDRIVPVKATDLLTLYGLILNLTVDGGVSALESTGIGTFELPASASGAQLANEPVISLNIASGVTAATIYFVADYVYDGIYLNGVATTPSGDVDADGSTLYKAVLADSAITITKVGF